MIITGKLENTRHAVRSIFIALSITISGSMAISCGSSHSSTNLSDEKNSESNLSRQGVENALATKEPLKQLKDKVHAVLDSVHLKLPWKNYETHGPFQMVQDRVNKANAFSLSYTDDVDRIITGKMFFLDIDESLFNKADLMGKENVEGVQLVGAFKEGPVGISSILPSDRQFSSGFARLFVFWEAKTFPGYSEKANVWITYKNANEPKLNNVPVFSEKEGWKPLAPMLPKPKN